MRVNPNSLLAVLVGFTLLPSIHAAAAVLSDGSGSARFVDVGPLRNIDVGGSLDPAFEYHGDSGDAVALLTKEPLPSLSTSLVSSEATPTTGYSNLGLDAGFHYYFEIEGPTVDTVVPVLISGNYWMSTAGNDYSISMAQVQFAAGGGLTNYGFDKYCYNSCNEGSDFTGLIDVYSGRVAAISVSIALRSISSIQGGISSASAYIDPYIYIDPTWALTHPGYSVSVSNGFGNTAAVPEAETYAMMLAGLGLVGFMARGRTRIEA
jgi:hypothetical protein